jgi:hypothetical protein
MGDTTALALRSTLITLTGGTTTFLGNGLNTGTSDITKALSLLEDVAVLIIPVVKDVFDNVAPKWQIVN